MDSSGNSDGLKLMQLMQEFIQENTVWFTQAVGFKGDDFIEYWPHYTEPKDYIKSDLEAVKPKTWIRDNAYTNAIKHLHQEVKNNIILRYLKQGNHIKEVPEKWRADVALESTPDNIEFWKLQLNLEIRKYGKNGLSNISDMKNLKFILKHADWILEVLDETFASMGEDVCWFQACGWPYMYTFWMCNTGIGYQLLTGNRFELKSGSNLKLQLPETTMTANEWHTHVLQQVIKLNYKDLRFMLTHIYTSSLFTNSSTIESSQREFMHAFTCMLKVASDAWVARHNDYQYEYATDPRFTHSLWKEAKSQMSPKAKVALLTIGNGNGGQQGDITDNPEDAWHDWQDGWDNSGGGGGGGPRNGYRNKDNRDVHGRTNRSTRGKSQADFDRIDAYRDRKRIYIEQVDRAQTTFFAKAAQMEEARQNQVDVTEVPETKWKTDGMVVKSIQDRIKESKETRFDEMTTKVKKTVKQVPLQEQRTQQIQKQVQQARNYYTDATTMENILQSFQDRKHSNDFVERLNGTSLHAEQIKVIKESFDSKWKDNFREYWNAAEVVRKEDIYVEGGCFNPVIFWNLLNDLNEGSALIDENILYIWILQNNMEAEDGKTPQSLSRRQSLSREIQDMIRKGKEIGKFYWSEQRKLTQLQCNMVAAWCKCRIFIPQGYVKEDQPKYNQKDYLAVGELFRVHGSRPDDNDSHTTCMPTTEDIQAFSNITHIDESLLLQLIYVYLAGYHKDRIPNYMRKDALLLHKPNAKSKREHVHSIEHLKKKYFGQHKLKQALSHVHFNREAFVEYRTLVNAQAKAERKAMETKSSMDLQRELALSNAKNNIEAQRAYADTTAAKIHKDEQLFENGLKAFLRTTAEREPQPLQWLKDIIENANGPQTEQVYGILKQKLSETESEDDSDYSFLQLIPEEDWRDKINDTAKEVNAEIIADTGFGDASGKKESFVKAWWNKQITMYETLRRRPNKEELWDLLIEIMPMYMNNEISEDEIQDILMDRHLEYDFRDIFRDNGMYYLIDFLENPTKKETEKKQVIDKVTQLRNKYMHQYELNFVVSDKIHTRIKSLKAHESNLSDEEIEYNACMEVKTEFEANNLGLTYRAPLDVEYQYLETMSRMNKTEIQQILKQQKQLLLESLWSAAVVDIPQAKRTTKEYKDKHSMSSMKFNQYYVTFNLDVLSYLDSYR